MRLFVAITDGDWFSYLSSAGPLDEVNFWQPSGNVQLRPCSPVSPFFSNCTVRTISSFGGGFFSHFTILPVSLAWKSFGQENGAPTNKKCGPE